jgi:hypothetical protein
MAQMKKMVTLNGLQKDGVHFINAQHKDAGHMTRNKSFLRYIRAYWLTNLCFLHFFPHKETASFQTNF